MGANRGVTRDGSAGAAYLSVFRPEGPIGDSPERQLGVGTVKI
jgi:hypothetical protein